MLIVPTGLPRGYLDYTMPQNMAGHVLTKELAIGESSGAEMTQNPGVVKERRQISQNNSDSDDGLFALESIKLGNPVI